MILFLQQQAQSWLTATNALIGFLIFIVTVIGALLIILSKRREEVQNINSQRADASDKLVKVRDTEIADCEKRCTKIQEELEDTTAELRVISAIILDKLVIYWQEYETVQAKLGNLERDNRVLRRQLDMSDPPNN